MDIDFDALLSTALADAVEHLDRLEQLLLRVERSGWHEEDFATALRTVHSLKGDASCVGLDVVARFAHRTEDVLVAARDGEIDDMGDTITLGLRAVDVLRTLLSADAQERASALVPPQILHDFDRLFDAAPVVSLTPRSELVGAVADHATPSSVETLRVSISRLDHMLNLTGEVAIERARLRKHIEALPAQHRRLLLEATDTANRLDAELQQVVLQTRMVPLGPLFQRHIRTVRELTFETNKRARLIVEGHTVEVDTAILQQLRDPLTHLVRNAVYHGIEPADERARAGKPACGTVTVRACHQEGNIVVEVSDDGRGLDSAAIIAQARAAGLVTGGEQPDVSELVFASGLSTVHGVNSISGRGVGMDVVRRNIEALRGSVAVSSKPGVATTIRVQLPLTLAIMDGFAVDVVGTTYVIPLTSVVECFDLPPVDDARAIFGYVPRRGLPLPYVRLSRFFDLRKQGRSQESVIVVQEQGALVGLAVDQLFGEQQAVVKSLGKLFSEVAGVAGSTIMADGRVGLILDTPALLKAVRTAARTMDGVSASDSVVAPH